MVHLQNVLVRFADNVIMTVKTFFLILTTLCVFSLCSEAGSESRTDPPGSSRLL